MEEETRYEVDDGYHITATSPEEIEKAFLTLAEAEKKAREVVAETVKGITLAHKEELFEEINVYPGGNKITISFNLHYPIERIHVLRGRKDTEEQILIEKDRAKVVLPRNVVNQYGASCDADQVGSVPAHLIIHVLAGLLPKDSLLDKGICSMHQGKPATVEFHLKNIDKYLGEGEISAMIKKVKERVDEVMEDIFKTRA